VRDHDSGRYNLHRWEFEVQQRFRGATPNQRLTLHGFVATTNTNADVPFYLLYTLGGTGGLKTFRPELLGGDGTRATLRGFRNFRFRDRDLVLMQAEYRIPVHKYVHTSVFVDAGQVAPRTSELFSDVRANTGFSVSAVRKGKTLGRLDVGFGGGEGVYFYWSFGAFQD
jgi:outer membrane protein assembly factor BamA